MPASTNDKTALPVPPPPLDPPKFSALPTDDYASHPSRYELWSVRIPAHVDPVALLDGTTMELKGALLADSGDADADGNGSCGNGSGKKEISAATLGSIVSSAVVNGSDGNGGAEVEEHALMLGHDAEAASYRVLVKGSGGSGSSKKSKESKRQQKDNDNGDGSDSDSSSSSSSSSSSDDDSEKKDQDKRSDVPPSARMMAARHAQPQYHLRPLPKSFDRHLSLVALPPGGSDAYHDMTLAPSAERAPEWTTGDQKVKVAYVPVRQVQGLKRRWMPVGAAGGADKLGVDKPKVGEQAVMKCVGAFGNGESGAGDGQATPAKKARVEAQESTKKSSGKKEKKSAKKDKKKRKGKD